MTPLRRFPIPLLALLALGANLTACSGGGAPSDDPGGGGGAVLFQKPAGSGDGQSGVVGDTLATELTVLVTQDGVPASGWVVTFAPTVGSGAATAVVDTSDGSGVARTRWILGTTAGPAALKASLPGGSLFVMFQATGTPDAPAQLLDISGAGQAQEVGAAFATPLTLKVQDVYGNAIAGVRVGWAVLAGTAALSADSTTTGADGRTSVSLTAGDSVGPVTVRATAVPLPGAPLQFALHVAPTPTVVTVASNFFSPAAVTIPVGGAIKWSWTGQMHNVGPLTGPAEFPTSPILSTGATFGPVVFDVAGVYTYECSLHPGMTGTITVQ